MHKNNSNQFHTQSEVVQYFEPSNVKLLEFCCMCASYFEIIIKMKNKMMVILIRIIIVLGKWCDRISSFLLKKREY